MELRVLLEDVLSYCPDLFVDSPPSRLDRQDEEYWAGEQLRLIRRKEEVRSLDKPPVVRHCINLLREVVVVLKILVPLKCNLIAVE